MKNTHTFGIVFQVLKILPPDLLFLVVYIRFYISRYHFHKFLKLHSILSEEKDFRYKFSFFNGFTQIPFPPTP